jgi:DNA-directed RNA polymerase sigma subunit (sigma70/sigma32)
MKTNRDELRKLFEAHQNVPDARERKLIETYLTEQSLRQCGAKYGITGERVRQILKIATEKLR